MDTITAYPLSYPTGWARTPKHKITRSKFGKAGYQRTPPSTWQGIQSLNHELHLLGARDVIVSTNLRLRNDGLPMSSQRNPEDAGAAVYFQLNGKPRVLACDRWLTVGENLWAIAKDIEAQRGRIRWGVGTLDQAFTGYAALPAQTGEDWQSALGLNLTATVDEVNAKYRQMIKERGAHPDLNDGAREEFERLTRARDAALKALQ